MGWNPLDASGAKRVVKVTFFIAGAVTWIWFLHSVWHNLMPQSALYDRSEFFAAAFFVFVASRLGGGIYDVFAFLISTILNRDRTGGSRRRQ